MGRGIKPSVFLDRRGGWLSGRWGGLTTGLLGCWVSVREGAVLRVGKRGVGRGIKPSEWVYPFRRGGWLWWLSGRWGVLATGS